MKKKMLEKMTLLVQNSIALYKKRLAEYRQIEKLLESLPKEIRELPIQDIYLMTWSWQKADLEIKLPWVAADIEKHRSMLKAAGWVSDGDFEDLENGLRHEDYESDLPFSLNLVYDAGLSGASCVITKIGEKKEVKEVVTPIFEVTCPEGAAEKVFEHEPR